MAQVDILKGVPVEKLKQLQRQESDMRVKETTQKGIELVEDIKSKKGQILISRMKSVLEDRIVALVKNDAECQGILKVLSEIGTEIELAKAASENLIKKSLRME